MDDTTFDDAMCGGRDRSVAARQYKWRRAAARFKKGDSLTSLDHLEEVVDDLRARGVALESIKEGTQKTNERGIADLADCRLNLPRPLQTSI